MADRVIRTLIQYGFDEAALNQLRAKSAENRRIIEQTVANIKQLDVVGRQTSNGGLKALDNLFKQSDKNVRNYTSGLKDLRKAATDAERAAAQAASNQSFFGGLADPTGGIFGGRRGRGRGSLSRIGSEVRALPSVQTGLGFGTDAIGNVLRMAGVIEQLGTKIPLVTKVVQALTPALGATGAAFAGVLVTAAPVIAAVGGVAAVFITAANRAEEARKATEAGLDAQTQLLLLAERGNRTEIENKIQELDLSSNVAKKQLDMLRFIANAATEASKNVTDEGAFAGTVAAMEPFRQVLIDFGVISEKDELSLDILNQKLVEYQKIVDGAARDTQKLNALLANDSFNDPERLATLQRATEQAQRLFQIAATGTTESLNAQIEANNARIEIFGKEIESIQSLGLTSDEATKRMNDLQTSVDDLTRENLRLNSSIREQIKLREEEEYKKKQAQEITDTVKKYTETVTKLETDYQEARAAAIKKYNDTLVKIAEDAAEAAADALTKLRQQRDDLLTDFGRANVEANIQAQQDRLDNLIDFQRDEARAARDHADEMVRIQRERENEEQDLIASRDFAGLFRLRRDTNTQLQETNRQYERERQERIIAYQQKNEDDARQAAYEQQARDRKFQQQNADLELNYRRELSSIELQRSRALNAAIRTRNEELAIIQDKYVTASTLLYNSTQEELNILRMGRDERINIAREEQASLTAIAGRVFGGSSPSGGGRYTPTRANSGSLMAGQLSSVNERLGQREMFNGSLLPMGKGLFFPMQNGMVSQGKGDGAQISLTFNVRGNNPEATAQAVRKQVSGVLQDFFG